MRFVIKNNEDRYYYALDSDEVITSGPRWWWVIRQCDATCLHKATADLLVDSLDTPATVFRLTGKKR